MQKLKIEKIEKITLSEWSAVKLKRCGKVSEILYSAKGKSQGGYIKKISKEQYIDTRTGEVCDFQHIKNRADDKQNVSKTLSKGRDLINCNITDNSRVRWVTLTYAENMTNPERLYLDFKHFNEKLRKIYGKYEYITCAEPQARGAWHLHCLLIFPDIAPFIPNSELANIWRKGFVKIQKLDNVDNVGAYLTAYLGDFELAPNSEYVGIGKIKELEFIDGNGQKTKKRFIKGGRLWMYPPNFHIFRWSRGIKSPEIDYTDYKTAKEKAGSVKPTFSKTVRISTGDYVNELQYEYYHCNTDLRKNQEFDEKNNIT